MAFVVAMVAQMGGGPTSRPGMLSPGGIGGRSWNSSSRTFCRQLVPLRFLYVQQDPGAHLNQAGICQSWGKACCAESRDKLGFVFCVVVVVVVVL